MRPAAVSAIILPVGVGLMSRGPTGALGFTITIGSPSCARREHGLLGQVFGALVGADHLVQRVRRRLVGRGAVADQPERRDAAAIHHALHAGRLRRQEQRARALDIGAVHLRRVGDPQPVIRRDVDHVAAAGHCAPERGRVPQVALGQLGRQPGDVRAVAAGPHQQAQGVAAAKQGAGDGRADEAGRAGDESGSEFRHAGGLAQPGGPVQGRALRCHRPAA